MKRLNIFIDETGEFGFGKGSSELYGVSFTFHEQQNSINHELNILNDRLDKIGYTDMIHMADLIMHRGDYTNFSIFIHLSKYNYFIIGFLNIDYFIHNNKGNYYS